LKTKIGGKAMSEEKIFCAYCGAELEEYAMFESEKTKKIICDSCIAKETTDPVARQRARVRATQRRIKELEAQTKQLRRK
jgi:hypothetical protein